MVCVGGGGGGAVLNHECGGKKYFSLHCKMTFRTSQGGRGEISFKCNLSVLIVSCQIKGVSHVFQQDNLVTC